MRYKKWDRDSACRAASNCWALLVYIYICMIYIIWYCPSPIFTLINCFQWFSAFPSMTIDLSAAKVSYHANSEHRWRPPRWVPLHRSGHNGNACLDVWTFGGLDFFGRLMMNRNGTNLHSSFYRVFFLISIMIYVIQSHYSYLLILFEHFWSQ